MKPEQKKSKSTKIPLDFFAGIKIPILIVALVTIVFAVYGNSLPGEFLYDDESQIVENTRLHKSNIANLFKYSLLFDKKNVGFYRPIQSLTIKSDYFLWGLDPKGFHLTNILLHAFVSLLIFALCLKITSFNRFISFWASALYAAHPMHTSAVAYISGRADILAFLFLLIMMILWLPFNPDSTRHFGEKIRYLTVYCLFL